MPTDQNTAVAASVVRGEAVVLIRETPNPLWLSRHRSGDGDKILGAVTPDHPPKPNWLVSLWRCLRP